MKVLLWPLFLLLSTALPGQTAEEWLEKADGTRDPEEAFGYVQKALDLSPDFLAAWSMRAYLHYATEDWDAYLADAKHAITLPGGYPTWLVDRALAYSFHGHLDSAIADLSEYISLHPDHLTPYLYRGNMKMELEKYKAARKDFEVVVEGQASYWEGWEGLGKAYYKERKFKPAIEAFAQLAKYHPTYADTYNYLGLCRVGLKEYPAALPDFDKAIALGTGDVELYYCNRGICKMELKDYAAARADMETAIEINPDFQQARMLLMGMDRKAAEADQSGQ